MLFKNLEKRDLSCGLDVDCPRSLVGSELRLLEGTALLGALC